MLSIVLAASDTPTVHRDNQERKSFGAWLDIILLRVMRVSSTIHRDRTATQLPSSRSCQVQSSSVVAIEGRAHRDQEHS